MQKKPLSKKLSAQIERAVKEYLPRRADFLNLSKRVEIDLIEHAELKPFIHSIKRREKDPEHLRDKLERKAREALKNGDQFTITWENLFTRIGDLAGVRLLHIHTEQLSVIHPTIIKILNFYKYTLRESPLVYIWDVERKDYFEKLGLDVKIRPNMYTSVHYTFEPHWEKIACELQVRTLAEELWGETSHTINYPHETESIACREQLASLARVASGCTRLVDSIFASKNEHEKKFLVH